MNLGRTPRAVQALDAWAQTENLESCQLALRNIDQPIVADRICGRHEETWPYNIVQSVMNDALYRLAVVESDPDPEAFHRGKPIMEEQIHMARLARKVLYEKHSLYIGQQNIFNHAGLKMLQAD